MRPLSYTDLALELPGTPKMGQVPPNPGPQSLGLWQMRILPLNHQCL